MAKKYSKLPSSSSHIQSRSSLKRGSDRLTKRDWAKIYEARREEEAYEPEYTGLRARLYAKNQQRKREA